MRQLIKFFIFFLIAYGALLFCFYSDAVRIKMNSFYSKTTSSFIKLGLPSAHIETQNVFLPNRKIDPQKVFLVYGNPETIKNEMEEARRNRLSEVKISTKSTHFYFFELFTVPLLFLASLFIATPMKLGQKLLNLIIAMLFMFLYINSKTIFYALSVISDSTIGIYKLSQSSSSMLTRFINLTSLGFSITLAFILWLIFGFRKSEIATFFSSYFDKIIKEN